MIDRERLALVRLVLMSVAWAAGSTGAMALRLYQLDTLVGIGLAALAYWLTRDLGRPGRRRQRGELKYWRGRPVDDLN